MKHKLSYFIYSIIGLIIIAFVYFTQHSQSLPVVAIANYGSHASLNETIKGFKAQMQSEGFIEGKDIRYELADVNFDPALIPQMLMGLKAKQPKLMLVMTTPVAQTAKAKIKDIPLIYSAITDPVAAGLIPDKYTADANMTGSSEMQNMKVVLKFAKSILPTIQKIGLLYSTSESNDQVLVQRMQKSADELGLQIVAIPVDQARDVAVRVKELSGKVDMIYVGTSGPIQPTLPVIAAEARRLAIPLFNADSQAVKDGLALASFGIDYFGIGKNAGHLAVQVLKGKAVGELQPIDPNILNYRAVINKKIAKTLKIELKSDLINNADIID